MSNVVEQIEIEVDGQTIIVERLEDGTFRKPAYLAGAEREIVGGYTRPDGSNPRTAKQGYQADYVMGNSTTCKMIGESIIAAPATPAAATWEGYGSALKPAVEVIAMARKPLDGTIAANCERYGSGALNIDASRIGTNGHDRFGGGKNGSSGFAIGYDRGDGWTPGSAAGRWPANLVLSHLPGCKRVGTKRVKGSYLDHECTKDSNVYGAYGTERRQGYTDPNGLETVDAWECAPGCPVGLFPVTTSGAKKSTDKRQNGYGGDRPKTVYGQYKQVPCEFPADSGSAARFFYQATWELDQAEQLDAADVLRYAAKASRAERDAGLEGFEPQSNAERDGRNQYKNGNALNGSGKLINGTGHITPPHNHHPTVKPLSLCRYLAMLLLPPAAYAPRRILVPFGGVASEAIGVMLAGWDEVVMVEREREYCDIAEARVAYWQGKMDKQIALPLEVLA